MARDKEIRVYITESEWQRVVMAADADERSVSTWVRHAIWNRLGIPGRIAQSPPDLPLEQ